LEQQQLALLDVVKRGVLNLGEEEALALVNRLREYLPAWMKRHRQEDLPG
jgi:hypothetical protein